MIRQARWAVPLVATLVVAGCNVHIGDGHNGSAGDTVRTREVIARDKAAKAELVQADLNMAAGELRLSGGSSEFLEADFAYNVPSWKPEVVFDNSGFRGRLSVKQGKGETTIGNVKNEWILKLADNIPLDLTVRCGAGENKLDLRELTMRSVEVHIGAGSLELDLRGKPGKDFEVRVNGGVGEANVKVPTDIGVIAEAHGGIGSIHVHGMRKEGGRWVNEAYGKAKSTIRLNVNGGIGEINISAE